MNTKHHFVLDCIPTPQARARHSSAGGFVRSYKAKGQVRNEIELDALIREFKPDMPKELPIAIYIKIYLPIPQSKSKKFKAECESEMVPVAKKPDLDNYVKNILDTMTRAQFWRDDSQVAVLSATKTYSPRPRWEVEYYEIEG